jgi:hypothetical protein
MCWTLQNLKVGENKQHMLHYGSIFRTATVHAYLMMPIALIHVGELNLHRSSAQTILQRRTPSQKQLMSFLCLAHRIVLCALNLLCSADCLAALQIAIVTSIMGAWAGWIQVVCHGRQRVAARRQMSADIDDIRVDKSADPSPPRAEVVVAPGQECSAKQNEVAARQAPGQINFPMPARMAEQQQQQQQRAPPTSARCHAEKVCTCMVPDLNAQCQRACSADSASIFQQR